MPIKQRVKEETSENLFIIEQDEKKMDQVIGITIIINNNICSNAMIYCAD